MVYSSTCRGSGGVLIHVDSHEDLLKKREMDAVPNTKLGLKFVVTSAELLHQCWDLIQEK